MFLKTGNCVQVIVLLILQHAKNQEVPAKNFYTNLLKRDSRRCQIYNGTICEKYIKGKLVLIQDEKPLADYEKKLRKWFKQSKESGQISRECWSHAEALTCMHFYQECHQKEAKKTLKPTLCSEHCKFLRSSMCKGEYKRTIHSPYMQQFIPICDEISIYDDSKGEFCYFLPTIDLRSGPVPHAEPTKKIRNQIGSAATLKCFFRIHNFFWKKDNLHLITEGTWYKNNKRIVGNRRMSTKTKQKGKARLFMALKIRDVNEKDEGKYRCVISFGNKTVEAYTHLYVDYPKSNPNSLGVVKKVSKNNNNNNREMNKVPQTTSNRVFEISDGKCVPYGKGICERYFKQENGESDYVFEENNQPLELVNKQLENIITTLMKSKQFSSRCIEFGRPVLCYNKFYRCQNITNQPSHSLCKKDCELFKNVFCKKELAMITAETGLRSLYIPQCNSLPDKDDFCISISKEHMINSLENKEYGKNAIHTKISEMSCYDENSSNNYIGKLSMTRSGIMCDNWKNYKDFYHIDHDYCRNFGDNKPWCYANKIKEYCSIKPCPILSDEVTDPTCYTNNGEYYGRKSESESGRPCLPWNMIYSYSNLDHSYCRNYGKNKKEPWCYVDLNTEETCGIPKCITSDKVSQDNVSIVAYIVPSIIGASIVLFSIVLVIFYLRNKKMLSSSPSHLVKVSTNESVDTPIVGTLSTTASFDFKSDFSSTEEKSPPSIQRRMKRCSKNTPEVKEEYLINLLKIGDGDLGQLFQGEYAKSRSVRIPILVRKLRFDTSSTIASEFRQEMNLLRSLKHRHIQQVACVSAMSEVPFIAFECHHTQDLKEYLKVNTNIKVDEILNQIYQICSGVEYLHSCKVVIKDLAARNCFISKDNIVQISKSGLGMYRYPNDYRYLPVLGLAPVRWLPPETFQTGMYKYPSDIYMFGVTMWEMFSHGNQPYIGYNEDDVITYILNGEHLYQPSCCPNNVWNLIKSCWNIQTTLRPTFSNIKDSLKHMNNKDKLKANQTT